MKQKKGNPITEKGKKCPILVIETLSLSFFVKSLHLPL